MLAFFSAFSLRAKLIGLALLSVLITVGYLWARWRIAAHSAVNAKAKANALEAARNTELRIAEKRTDLKERQRKVREQIAQSKSRDGFQNQGWGP